jgi:hypothetical protein
MVKRPTLDFRRLTGAIAVLAAVTVPLVTIQAQQQRQAAMTIEALSAKVHNLEDVEQISAVLIEYGRALDGRDFKAYSALFAKDGSWSGGLGSVSGGPQAIYDFMTSRIGGGPIGFGPTYHIMSSFKIDVYGDTATASSRWAFVTAARGPGIQVAGRYEDTLIRENGLWRIRSRRALNDLAPAPTTASAGTAAPSQGAATPAPPKER